MKLLLLLHKSYRQVKIDSRCSLSMSWWFTYDQILVINIFSYLDMIFFIVTYIIVKIIVFLYIVLTIDLTSYNPSLSYSVTLFLMLLHEM